MQVQIHSKGEVDFPLPGGGSERRLAVVYSTSEVPPRTIWVPLDQADDKGVAAAIRADLELVKTEAPTPFEV